MVIFQVGLDYISSLDYKNLKELATQLPCGVRYDFMVYPSGNELIHPIVKGIKLEQRTLTDWKNFIKDGYIEGKTMKGILSFDAPLDLENHFLSLDVFDESTNWIAWSGYVSGDGHVDFYGYLPILNGNYSFVIRHNDTAFMWGRFICHHGVCTVEGMEQWRDDHELAGVLKKFNKVRDLVFKDTTYGRQLKLLYEIWDDECPDGLLEGELLEERLAGL